MYSPVTLLNELLPPDPLYCSTFPSHSDAGSTTSPKPP
jgi:hypothetical protein